jgi:hypothetical protein
MPPHRVEVEEQQPQPVNHARLGGELVISASGWVLIHLYKINRKFLFSFYLGFIDQKMESDCHIPVKGA